MQKRHYKTILFFIVATILVTLGIQGYFNYKNYQIDKQQFINEAQIGLDNAVNTYYADLAEENILGFSFSQGPEEMDVQKLDSIFSTLDKNYITHPGKTDSVMVEVLEGGDMQAISIFSGDSGSNHDTLFKKLQIDGTTRKNMVRWSMTQDTFNENPLASLTTRVIYAIATDSLQLPVLNKMVAAELQRKNITASYSLIYKPDAGSEQILKTGSVAKNALETASTSSYLPLGSTLKMAISNSTLAILKRNTIGLLLSLIFVVSVIACLLYLFKIINRQKQLAEVKNDLISNITHEFKTPLATIGAAMEGIQVFNKNNDPEKTMKYASVSMSQVEKLNGMVEKLLETATLDSEQLKLNFEAVDIVQLLDTIAARERLNVPDKQLRFSTKEPTLIYEVDTFHFENAINNIVDNALKYGGNEINISLIRKNNAIEISITDNGRDLTAAQGKQIFDKFYRVPKGNTHNIKGFGIGLYYTKVIVEKHGGTISVQTQPTNFTIVLPL
ncbi:HAMP domain-containing histidine kinase [Rasiella rasia]|uniref:histidine kinase n=1 Tax=Rasiella rasia TaxID=2744027 RepID=A0A6G6GP83_9FLAO|nr:HAMP domain-containing sensor histidine kinase [Rasiella rasia]QIE60243.1 HAMP domain-containing histidine kinase [Rasiella rasia]